MWIWVNTVFFLTSLKTEIATSVKRPKLQELRAEDALAEPYLVQRMLVIWFKQITKFSVKIVNLETIIDMQSWCRSWPPNGSSRIRAKQKLLREHKGACKSSWSRIGSLKSIYTDKSLEFGKDCEDFPGIIARRTPHRSEINEIAERAVRGVKEGTSAVLLQSGLGENWWADSMECYTYLRNIQDLLSHGKTPYERRFGKPLKDRSFRLVHWVEYFPIPAKDQSRIHQFGKKVLPGLFPRIRSARGGNLEGWRTDHRPWGVGDDGRIGNLLEKTQCERGDISQRRRIYFSNRRWTNQNTWRRSGTENIHLDTGTPNSRRRSRRFSWRIRRVSSTISRLFPDAGEARNDFWSMSGNFINRHHVEPRVKLYSPREESFPIPLKYIDVSRTTHTNLDVKQERRIDDYWNIDGSRVCPILGQVSLSLL